MLSDRREFVLALQLPSSAILGMSLIFLSFTFLKCKIGLKIMSASKVGLDRKICIMCSAQTHSIHSQHNNLLSHLDFILEASVSQSVLHRIVVLQDVSRFCGKKGGRVEGAFVVNHIHLNKVNSNRFPWCRALQNLLIVYTSERDRVCNTAALMSYCRNLALVYVN